MKEEDVLLVASFLRELATEIEKSSRPEAEVDWGKIERVSSGILKVALDVRVRNPEKKEVD